MNARSPVMVTFIGLAMTLVGCAGLPTDGPSTGAIVSGSDLRVQTLTLAGVPEQRATFELPTPQAYAPAPSMERFVVASGDVLSIALFEGLPDGVFATPATGGSVFPNVPVREDGTIVLPYVGALRVEGRDVAAVRLDILARVRGFATRPDALVEITSRNRGSVSVAGAVKTPGRLTIGSDILTVQDALSKAGAPYEAPFTANVMIRKESGASQASLAQILAGPPLPLNGDTDLIITVQPAVFQAMGAVRRQGSHPLATAEVTLLNALSEAGGLDPMRANSRGVFVFRSPDVADPDPRPIVYQLDMRQRDAFAIAQRFLVRPGDTLYVTEAPVAQWTKVLSAIQGTVAVGASAATIERLAN